MTEKRRIGVLIGMAVLLRWSISYQPHSGQGKPLMYGDYEAQRHWQEVTFNLPVENWYKNTSDNDLQYWGLDYPPLTAYHSLVIGKIANLIDKKYVELFQSRGYESDEHKFFMRITVLISDLLIYLPAIFIYFLKIGKISTGKVISKCEQNLHTPLSNIFGFSRWNYILITALLYPGLILIDYGHFQYNCVSLGFFIFAVTMILEDFYAIGSFFFVLGLNYKQMELYHALPFFFYILGICKRQEKIHTQLKIFISVAFTVVATFSIIWFPFFQKWSSTVDVIVRLFPFSRGVFEDKVANFWCTLNVFIKLKSFLNDYQLARVCLAATGISIFPSCVDIFLKPTKEKFLLSLINISLGFYLFSFQVHEKSILLVAIPVLLYFHNDPLACFWFLIISVFSMLPLFIKDQLFTAYCSIMIFYFILIWWMWAKDLQYETKPGYRVFNISIVDFFYISMLGVIFLTIASVIIKPPVRYPDLFSLLISVYSCGHYYIFLLYFNIRQLSLPVTKKFVKSKLN